MCTPIARNSSISRAAWFGGNASHRQIGLNGLFADLVQLVQRDQRRFAAIGRNLARLEQARQYAAVIQDNREVLERQPLEHLGYRADLLRFDHRRRRSDGVDIALVELPEPPAGRTLRSPDRLDLVPLEDLRQHRLVLGDDASEGHRQVVAQREVRLARCLVLASLQNLEDELAAFFPVLPQKRVDVLGCWRLDGLEPIAVVHLADNPDHVVAAPHIVGQKIAHAARRLRRYRLSGHYM